MNSQVSWAMRSGLAEFSGDNPEFPFSRISGSQAMADAWLQWMFDGWLAIKNNEGHQFHMAEISAAQTAQSFDMADDIDLYFYESGLWEPSTDGDYVCTAGLLSSIRDFLSAIEGAGSVGGHEVSGGFAGMTTSTPNTAETTLEKLTGSRASTQLGYMFRGKRGFTSAKRSRNQSLWATGATQDRCWRVPFKFIGDK
jgi:hypothetical protein